MSSDAGALRARVAADLPWHPDRALRGILRIVPDALLLARLGLDAHPVAIPLLAITRTNVETGFGVAPALLVWHTAGGQEVRSRFEFILDDDEEIPQAPDIAGRVGPGLARDAARTLEGGLRALAGGLSQGKRVARQAVEGFARQEEYQAWSTAIAAAQAEARRRARDTAAPPPASSRPPSPAPPPLVPFDVVLPGGPVAARYAWLRATALPWLEACGERARALKVRDLPVIQRTYPLDSPVLRIVVLGEFSRGKSTVINAVFGIHGEIALPIGMTPTTPLACAIRVPNVGETDGATITYRTARPAANLSLDEFRAQVRLAEEIGGESAAAVAQSLHLDEAQRVEVRITGAYLPAGVEIEDTPGLNEAASRSAAAMSALGRADLVLFVLAADQLLGDLERDTIARMAQEHHRNVLFLVNFWDTIDAEAQQAALRQRVSALLGGFPTPFVASGLDEMPHVAYISALQAARAQRQRKPAPEESGVPKLRAQLRDLLGPQSTALLLRARSGRALRYLQLLRQSVSRAIAAEATRRTPTGATQRQEAETAALRVLEGLRGAVDGAMTRPLGLLHSFDTPGLARAAGLLTGATSPDELQEIRRIMVMELRQAAAACADAAQQAIDLVVAQARATFSARGVTAPALHAHIEPPALLIPPAGDVDALRTILSSAAAAIGTAIHERVDVLQNDLMAGVRTSSAPTPGPVDNGSQIQALRALEDDILRLESALKAAL